MALNKLKFPEDKDGGTYRRSYYLYCIEQAHLSIVQARAIVGGSGALEGDALAKRLLTIENQIAGLIDAA